MVLESSRMPNPRLIYLDNAATSWPKPAEVGQAMAHFLAESAGNPGRGSHRLARDAARVVESARGALARLINAERVERVVLTHGCTDSVNLAIHGWLAACLRRPGAAKPHVVMSSVEHNAVARTLHAHEGDGEIALTIVPCDAEGFTAPEAVLNACTPSTVLVCLSHASNACGTIQPIRAVGLGLQARAPGALLLVDAAQTAGHLPIDVQADRIDLLSIAGHKGLLGPTGTGALYVGPRAYSDDPAGPRLHCTRSGGTGARSPGLDMPPELPDAIEAGTCNAVGFAGLLAGMKHAPAKGHEQERLATAALIEGLRTIAGVRLHGRPGLEGRTSVVLFTIEGMPAREVGALLDGQFGIAVRAGLHCAPLLHRALGTYPDGAVRASPSPWTTAAEINALLDALREITTNAVAPSGT